MEWNRTGFLVPNVNTEACVDCGICVKQCPALNADESQGKVIRAFQSTGYAAWSSDEQILRESSSGGVFSEIAKYIIQQGGCVYGVRWEENLHARFHRIEREEEIAQFRCHYRNSAENFSRLLRFARSILKRYKEVNPMKLSYRSMKFKAALQEDFALDVLKTVFS